MNIRTGFRRVSIGLLVLSWAIWLVGAINNVESMPGRVGEQFGYGLMATVAYMLFCKGIAWVFNGFFPPQS